jgi:para-aminobenzoate synthetase component 1
MIRVPAPALEPGEALRRCARGERPFLLDGGGDADGLGRWTFAGCDPDDGFVWRGGDAGDALELLEAAQRRWSAGPIDDKPWPFAVGYVAYDLGEEIVARPAGRRFAAVDDLGLPLVDFARYRAVWRFDAASGAAEVLALDGASAERLLARLQRTPPPIAAPVLGAPKWAISDAEYRARVDRILEYLRAGDCYQVNLAHRLVTPLDELGVLAVYLRLRAGAPAPLGGFLATSGAYLLSNTPELFLRTAREGNGWRLETRPIKGTRRRGGASAEEDARLAHELSASEKDRAEHLMIVDLERNDLGRVAEIGSVEVHDFQRRVTLPTVHHLVSTVTARARAGLGLADLLRATFPGGSITGAPKLRAMEIIDELERVRRGPYCGALGWLGGGLRLDLALAIRTAVWRAGELILSVGGGIVADSTPDDELTETHIKAEAFLRAIG